MLTINIGCSKEQNNPIVNDDNNNGIIGDPTKTPTIEITNTGTYNISGKINNVTMSNVKVVLWAKTNQWYIQPFIASPFTKINNDGSWASYTHPWTRIVALLVNNSYVPGDIRQDHPALQNGVIAWDEKPEPSPDKKLSFSGYSWFIKDGTQMGPGPNYFSDSSSCVFLDNLGRLHLKTALLDGNWNCGEVYLEQALGYGLYTYQIEGRVDNFDINSVFSGFIYESLQRELDIEFSKVLAMPNNMQFVIQPYTVPGNIQTFMVGNQTTSTHQIFWYPDSVIFRSWYGLSLQPQAADIINEWTYKGPHVPPAEGNERMRFNLWLFEGKAPKSNTADEAIIKNFTFQKFNK